MNSKMTKNSQLLTTEPKKKKRKEKKLSKQLEQEQNHSNGDHKEGYQQGRCRERKGEKGTGNKKHNWYAQNRQEEIKNSIGNGEANELICTTSSHGCELVEGMLEGMGCCTKGDKGEKKMGQL